MKKHLGGAAATLILLVASCSASVTAPENVQDGYHFYEGSSEQTGQAGEAAQIKGSLSVTDSCWTLSTESGLHFIALPEGTVTFAQEDGTLAIQMGGGTQLAEGQELDLGGGYLTRNVSEDAQLAELVAACPSVPASQGSLEGVWEIASPNGYK